MSIQALIDSKRKFTNEVSANGSSSPSPDETRESKRMAVQNMTRRTQLADKLEIAGSGPKRTKGLLGRRELEPGGGMWIVPCEAVHTFFMQFPIDLVYLDRKCRVKKVRNSVPPWRISACLSAHSVVELPAGTIRKTQTERGDILEITETKQIADREELD